MKKIILLLFVLIFTVSGCNDNEVNEKPEASIINDQNTSTDKPFETISPNYEISDVFEKVDYLDIIYPAYKDRKYSNLGSWQQYIQKKHNIQLQVSYNLINANDLLSGMDTGEKIIYLNFADSTVYQFNTDVLKYNDDRFVYDLSPYYKKYGWDEIIEDEIIDKLIIDGKIFAVPAYENKYIIPRHYNKATLNELGMEMPENIDDFYIYLKAAKNLHSGDANYYPMFSLNSFLSLSTSDIFRSFDVYLNSEYNSPLTYNPKTGSFEDAVFSQNMEAALEYIRTLQMEDLFGIGMLGDDLQGNVKTETGFLQGFFDVNKNFATEYGVVYDTKYNFFIRETDGQISYEATKGYFLSGINNQYLCEVRQDLAFYVFPKSIGNIDGTINLFNTVFTDTQYYADLKYGIEGVDYQIYEDLIIVNPPAAGSFLGLKQINSSIDINNSYSTDSIKMLEMIDEKLCFEKNVFNQVFAYANERADLQIYMGDFMLDSIFNPNLSPYDAIEEYKEQFNKSGRITLLKQLNEKLGVETAFNYDED